MSTIVTSHLDETGRAWHRHLRTIAESAPTLDSQILCEHALDFLATDYPNFFSHPASTQPNQHHNYKYGLVRHTSEVLQIAFQSRQILQITDIVRFEDLFCAGLYHDAGKVLAYDTQPDGSWAKNKRSRRMHHIQLSLDMWRHMLQTRSLQFDDEHIVHCILSHHGCRKYGSPVAPATPTAQLLHQADTLSAFVTASTRVDLYELEKKSKGSEYE